MTQVTTDISAYKTDFEAVHRNGDAEKGVHAIRKAAFERFTELGFPSTRDEEWRFTNIAPIARTRFSPAREARSLPEAQIKQHPLFGVAEQRLVFVNGHYVESLSRTEDVSGLTITRLSEVIGSQQSALNQHLAKHAKYENHAFVALNTAFMDEGAYIHLSHGTIVEQPIHLLYFSTAEDSNAVTHPRNLIIADENAQVTVIETYIGLNGGSYFTNAVTEIVGADNAVVDHYRVQLESEEAFHVSTVDIHQTRDTNVSTQSMTFGGQITRNDVGTVLNGTGGTCIMNGMYFISDKQLVDNHTRIDHAMPHCESHELYKGILDDQSRGVFNGRIIVRQDAQKTNSKQTNQTLVLSEKATINTNPQLEIFADDVKCTHGATVGQLDENSLFYLRSRGIDQKSARRLLTFAFANDVIDRVKVEPLRAQLEKIVLDTQHASEARHEMETVK